jgi:SAM-dependent methyltransferase
MSSTFSRSCEHWSESGRREMEDFYALAWVDYRHLAEAVEWKTWFEARQRAVGKRPLRLLDVACGSGKFPAALVRDAAIGDAAIAPVDYALLDPSPFSIAEARAALSPPFVAGDEFECTLQDLPADTAPYDIVWATHALYAIPTHEIEAALQRFLAALHGGRGFIAHACADAHYLAFYRHYLEAFRAGEEIAPYTSAEQLTDTLSRLGASISVRDIEYVNGTDIEARDRVEGYLQRCLFDDTISLDQLLSHPLTGDYLARCQRDGRWQFRQRVKLIFINE